MYRRRGEGLDKGRFRFHARAHIRERMLAVFGCQAPNLVQIIGVEGGGLALCPVGCGALVVSCPPEGRISILPAGAWLISEVRSYQDQPNRTIRSKGEKRREKNNYPEVRALWVGGRQEE